MNLEQLTRELIRDEDERLRLYRCPAGKLTIGVGHNIEERGISLATSRFILAEDIAQVEADLDRALPWWRNLDDTRQRALANLCFNLGITKLLGFKRSLSLLEHGQYLEAAQAFLASKWAKQVGPRALRVTQMIRDGGIG